MNSLSDVVSLLWGLLVVPYVIIFMLLTYAFKKPIRDFLCNIFYKNSEKQPSMDWIVFVIATLVAIPFWIIPTWGADFVDVNGKVVATNKLRLLISYTFATTCHDLIIFQVIQLFKNITGQKTET